MTRFTPNLSIDAGSSYNAARALLAPLRATLTQNEFAELISLIGRTPSGQLLAAFSSMERVSSIAATSALMTRYGGEVGASEVSEIMATASEYMDRGTVMPPRTAKWKQNWFEALVPDELLSVKDRVGDFFGGLILPKSKEYNVEDPPSLLTGAQAPGYLAGITAVLTHNVEAYVEAEAKTAVE